MNCSIAVRTVATAAGKACASSSADSPTSSTEPCWPTRPTNPPSLLDRGAKDSRMSSLMGKVRRASRRSPHDLPRPTPYAPRNRATSPCHSSDPDSRRRRPRRRERGQQCTQPQEPDFTDDRTVGGHGCQPETCTASSISRTAPTVTVGPEQTGRIFNRLAATELGRRQIRMAVATSWCLARATVCLGRAVTSLEQQLRDAVAIRWSLPCCWESRSR